jgi:hypothetical protein
VPIHTVVLEVCRLAQARAAACLQSEIKMHIRGYFGIPWSVMAAVWRHLATRCSLPKGSTWVVQGGARICKEREASCDEILPGTAQFGAGRSMEGHGGARAKTNKLCQ